MRKPNAACGHCQTPLAVSFRGHVRSQWCVCETENCPYGIHHGLVVHDEGRVAHRLKVLGIEAAPPEVIAAIINRLDRNGGVPKGVSVRLAKAHKSASKERKRKKTATKRSLKKKARQEVMQIRAELQPRPDQPEQRLRLPGRSVRTKLITSRVKAGIRGR